MNTPWSWNFFLNPSIRDILAKWLDGTFDAKKGMLFEVLPTEPPPLCLSRREIIAVYYMIEVWWEVGGWLHERPSNVRLGKRSGHIGQMTYIQICDMFEIYRPFELYEVERWLLDLKWTDFSFEQKLLYFWLIRKWGLVK